jgi:hypothetical protein
MDPRFRGMTSMILVRIQVLQATSGTKGHWPAQFASLSIALFGQ